MPVLFIVTTFLIILDYLISERFFMPLDQMTNYIVFGLSVF